MKIIAVGDLHAPYLNKNYLSKAISRIKKEKPDVVIQLGDLFDQYMFGRFDKNLDFINPKKELLKAIDCGKDFWDRVRVASPLSEKHQLLGNHDMRILKKTAKVFPEAYHIIKERHNNMYKFKGVHTAKTDRDFLEYDGVIYCHGWMSSHINHFKQSVIRAHDHKVWGRIVGDNNEVFGGIIWKKGFFHNRCDSTMFEISAGMFADEKLIPFHYINSNRSNWQPAITITTPKTVELVVLDDILR